MAAPTFTIDPQTCAWLLDPAFPTVRRLALDRLGLTPREDSAARSAPTPGAPRVVEPWVRALLDQPDLGPDGRPVHPYQKWRGVHWRLVALAELGADPAEAQVRLAVEAAWPRIVGWVSGRERLRASRAIDGRVRQCASMDGNAAWAAVRLGLAADRDLASIVARLLEWQWPDGGWNCDKRPEAAHSSFNESWAPLRALAAYADAPGAEPASAGAARNGAQRAAAFLLEHRVDRSHRTGELAHPWLARLRWPPYWHYDRLQGLRALREAGRLHDPRTAAALDDLRAARGEDGRWVADGRYWIGPGSPSPGAEAAAWTRAGESRMLTLLALEVLLAA